MEIIETTPKEFQNVFDKPYHIFSSVAFTELNRGQYDSVSYLFFKEGKIKLGLTLAQRGDELCSPVSAPFGGFVFTKSDVSLSFIEGAVEALTDWVNARNMKLKFVIPPLFYENDFLSKCISVLSRSGFATDCIDLNYHIKIDPQMDYVDSLQYNAKKNLNIALKEEADYCFERVISDKGIANAYEIIRKNREAKGYPLRMTLDQVKATINVITADFFTLSFKGIGVAAAQVFHVAKGVVQVIYWGDISDYAQFRPMNYLAYKIVNYYAANGVQVVDLGPSTEHGVPNYGLCEYKESIGCSISMKYKFKLGY